MTFSCGRWRDGEHTTPPGHFSYAAYRAGRAVGLESSAAGLTIRSVDQPRWGLPKKWQTIDAEGRVDHGWPSSSPNTRHSARVKAPARMSSPWPPWWSSGGPWPMI